MISPRRWVGPLTLAAALVGCGRELTREEQIRETLRIPEHFATPSVPDENLPTYASIELGRHLFYDRRLSANQTQSCADCHHQELGFSDGLTTPTGSTGTVLERNSPGLANVAYLSTLTWSHDSLLHLEEQLDIPIRNDRPIELGVTDGVRDEVVARFASDAEYVAMFRAAFPDSPSGPTLNKVVLALSSFCRALISGASPYDRFLQGDATALTEQQRRGLTLFGGERLECFHCHAGTLQTVAFRLDGTSDADARRRFFNTGLYDVDGTGSYPAHDQGLYDVTLDPRHRGMFRPPSLRNVAVTAPYMHDGSIATLRGVLDHYASGGRLITDGPWAGDGRRSPLKSGLVRGFSATDEEIESVIAFLEALTDDAFLTDPAFSNPFE